MHLFHFLMGLVWLAVVTAVIFLYVSFPYFLYLLFRWYKTLRRERGGTTKLELGNFRESFKDAAIEFWETLRDLGVSLWYGLGYVLRPGDERGTPAWPPPLVRKGDRAVIWWLAVVVSCACLTAYVKQRSHWMGPDNAHLSAKEYFVSGEVLNGFRHIATTNKVRHPEHFDMRPLTALQWAIYRQGVKQLPENDGESGVWRNLWFHSHYSKAGRKALLVRGSGTSPWMRELLDQWWFSLEAMATRPIADKRMLEEHALRDYPALAFSYLRYKGFYTDRLDGSAWPMAKMPEHVERMRRLSDWLWALPEKRQASATARAFNAAHPKVVVLQQVDLLLALDAQIQGEIHERKFDCANVSIQRFIAARQELVQPEQGTPAYRQMDEPDQAQLLYEIAVEHGVPTKYVLEEYCGVEVAGTTREYDRRAESTGRTPEELIRESARSVYSAEIKIIEEKYKRE